jgi:hypothetical protein
MLWQIVIPAVILSRNPAFIVNEIMDARLNHSGMTKRICECIYCNRGGDPSDRPLSAAGEW